MEPQRWQRVQDLYHEAAAQAPSDRAGFLQARCTGDPELLSQVNALLASHDEPSTFLEPPTEKLAWLDTPPPDLVGQVIGNCTLTRLLGEGGMGAVYEGVQAPLNRPVAVKVLRAGLLSPSARERFEHESKILGQLRHPGIAQVFEAGTAQVPGGGSLPYFVMERIPGALPLKKAMDARGQNLRERVATFLEVARAVGHGHERGVIHRDLKPGNVLVDENGQPKVIDFGIARLTHEEDEREFPTMEGMLVGTLQYMSPEQLRGKLDQVDTRSDVYALGIMMYEAFLDERPHHFDGQDLPEILERVLKEPPLRPRRANPKFDPDLEAILLCAVALERSERYATASALAEDLDRFLRGEPVVARAITFGSSLGWFAKRHRRLLIAGSVVLAVALAGAAISLHFAWEAHQARAAADRRADQALRLVQSAQDLAQWTITNLDVELADLRGSTRVRRLLADRMQGYLATLGDELPDAPGFRRSLARALLAMAEVEGSPGRPNAGRPEAALERAREAEALLRRLATDRPHDPEAAHDLAAVHLVIAELVAVTAPSDVDEAFRTVQRSESAAGAGGAGGARGANPRSGVRPPRAPPSRRRGATPHAPAPRTGDHRRGREGSAVGKPAQRDPPPARPTLATPRTDHRSEALGRGIPAARDRGGPNGPGPGWGPAPSHRTQLAVGSAARPRRLGGRHSNSGAFAHPVPARLRGDAGRARDRAGGFGSSGHRGPDGGQRGCRGSAGGSCSGRRSATAPRLSRPARSGPGSRPRGDLAKAGRAPNGGA